MKNKKITVIIICVVIFCICFITGAIILKCNSGYKNTDLLLKGLERAVNNTDDTETVFERT